MAARLFFAAVLGLLQLSLGKPTVWSARLLSEDEGNNTNVTDMSTTTTTSGSDKKTDETTTTTAADIAYHKVLGVMVLDVDDPASFVADADGKRRAGIAKSLAKQLNGVEEDMINVTLGLEDARRLAAGRALAGQKVVVTYVITLQSSDASDVATLGNDIVTAISTITPAAMKTSLAEQFQAQGLEVVLGDIVIDTPTSQAVESLDEVVTTPEPTEPTTPSTTSSTSTTSSPEPSEEPTSSTSSSPPPTNGSSSGSGDDEEDGSVRPGPACVLVFGLLALLRTSQA